MSSDRTKRMSVDDSIFREREILVTGKEKTKIVFLVLLSLDFILVFLSFTLFCFLCLFFDSIGFFYILLLFYLGVSFTPVIVLLLLLLLSLLLSLL